MDACPAAFKRGGYNLRLSWSWKKFLILGQPPSTVSQKFCPWFWPFIKSSNHRNKKKYEYPPAIALYGNVESLFLFHTLMQPKHPKQRGMGGQVEIRNTKQYRNANFQNSKQKFYDTIISRFGHWYFCHLYLFRVSIFEFRIFPSPQMGEMYESIRIFQVAILVH